MNRTKFKEIAQAKGLMKRDINNKKIHPEEGAYQQLRQNLIHYFKNTPDGQDAWDRRPRITGEGVADYVTIDEMVDALLREADD